MDVVGSEIGQKMRSAIKAKLTELGCYVDDELPDYVMVMVANKRTRSQMEDDLQLFLGDNTLHFVNWLHQVLKKLQEVTVAAPAAASDEKVKEKKEKKSKDKKEKSRDKHKKSDKDKDKKKKKSKDHKKKELKRLHKSKKKTKVKENEIIRPNIPPLLMNLEKNSEPSITDVFAGQILKNHGITMDTIDDNFDKIETKPNIADIKVDIIDSTLINKETDTNENTINDSNPEVPKEDVEEVKEVPKDAVEEVEEVTKDDVEEVKEVPKEKPVENSDDEDFLNIRTEAEELNDLNDDKFQQTPKSKECTETPPLSESKQSDELPTPNTNEMELPQIELNLPKRSIRERLGAREEPKKNLASDNFYNSERFTPDREPEPQKSAKSRLGDVVDNKRKPDEDSNSDYEHSSKKITSKISVLSTRDRPGPASVVKVRPRPRATNVPASNLLLRAVADAQKSLLNIPPKREPESKIKRALVLPMRRDSQKIVIQVPQVRSSREPSCEIEFDTESLADIDSDYDRRDIKGIKKTVHNDGAYAQSPIKKKIFNADYVANRREYEVDETLIVQTINSHKKPNDKEKGPTFVVTLDGLDPNIFLAKKLKTEGIIEEEEELKRNKDKSKEKKSDEITLPKKRLSDTSEESDTQVIIEPNKDIETDKPQIEESNVPIVEKRRLEELKEESLAIKKRKASPIVFGGKEKEQIRERTESASSDGHVTITTSSTNKYDAIPSLPPAPPPAPCRTFPACRFGAACAFAHPPCRFGAQCVRRACVYEHGRPASVASHVVPAANYKTISSAAVPNMCKFYPNCVNPTCHFYHPKPCRYGKTCVNKLECNFYHNDVQSQWRVA